MLHVILDTNIYGKILDDKEYGGKLSEKLKKDPSILVHNFRLIRQELRGAPKLLPLYDSIVAQRVINETQEIKNLASAYFIEYKNNRGVQGQQKILNDFKIVACASILGCDIIFSDDRKTLQSPVALHAYRVSNVKKRLRTPTFHSYNDLKQIYF